MGKKKTSGFSTKLDTIEDYITQIRRNSLGDLTILSNFHIKTSSLRSASDYESRL